MQYGQTPFLRAAARGHVEVASYLLDNGSSILEQADVSDHQLPGTCVPHTLINFLHPPICIYVCTEGHLIVGGGELYIV